MKMTATVSKVGKLADYINLPFTHEMKSIGVVIEAIESDIGFVLTIQTFDGVDFIINDRIVSLTMLNSKL